MKKAHHNKVKEFQTLSGGVLYSWSLDSIERVIDGANWAASLYPDGKMTIYEPSTEFILEMHTWFSRLVDSRSIQEHDLVKRESIHHQRELARQKHKLVSDLNQVLQSVPYIRCLELDSNGELLWKEVPNFDAMDHPRAIAAYKFAYYLANGVLDNLKRCEREECRKFFIRARHAKYCSDSCGSMQRTKKSRDKKKQERLDSGDRYSAPDSAI
jgi:hypothetical protein